MGDIRRSFAVYLAWTICNRELCYTGAARSNNYCGVGAVDTFGDTICDGAISLDTSSDCRGGRGMDEKKSTAPESSTPPTWSHSPEFPDPHRAYRT